MTPIRITSNAMQEKYELEMEKQKESQISEQGFSDEENINALEDGYLLQTDTRKNIPSLNLDSKFGIDSNFTIELHLETRAKY